MTDELTPEQEAAVRRLLAEARHDEPLPGDVAARLDDTLADLVAGRGADGATGEQPPEAAPVTHLSAVRHRRRNAGRLLLAAAAVLVGGVAVGQYVGDTGGGDADDAGSAATELEQSPRDSADRDEAAGGDTEQVRPEAGAVTDSSAMDLLNSIGTPLVLTSDNFALDVQRELARTASARRQAANADYDGVLAFTAANGDFDCPDGAYGEGATLPAYYDGEEAVLVLRPPRSGIQRVDLLTCGTATELNSMELPA